LKIRAFQVKQKTFYPHGKCGTKVNKTGSVVIYEVPTSKLMHFELVPVFFRSPKRISTDIQSPVRGSVFLGKERNQ